MWNSKIVAWLEQKLISITSALYIKRREEAQPEPVANVAPTMEAPVKKRTFVKRTEPAITKSAPVVKKTKQLPKATTKKAPATKKPVAKPAVKKAAPKKPAVKKAAPKSKAKAK